MKAFKKMAALVACGALALALGGCQQPQDSKQEQQSDSARSMAVTDKQETNKEPFYVLIVGNDSRIGTVFINDEYYADGVGRSDTMMIARIDPENYQVTLVTIPRDTACTIDGETYKINEAYRQSGIEGAIEQAESLTGVKIKYYFDTGFAQFEEMVNGWGGVTANVPFAFSMTSGVTGEPVELSAGEQHLDGADALALARMRKEYPNDQDAMRQIQDRQLVERAIRQVAEDPARVVGDLDTLLANTDTNWPTEDLMELVSDFVAHSDSLSFYSGTGPYDGGIDESAGGAWLATRDEATWARIIDVVDGGGDPTTVLPLPTME